MDEDIRRLQRGAREGDEAQERTLDRAWDRLGLGWSGESLPDGARRGTARGRYLWTVGPVCLEMVSVGPAAFWMAVGPVSMADYSALGLTVPSVGFAANGLPSPSGVVVPLYAEATVRYEDATAFCAAMRLELPTVSDWDQAVAAVERDLAVPYLPGPWFEWCSDDGRSEPPSRGIYDPRTRTRKFAFIERPKSCVGFRPIRRCE